METPTLKRVQRLDSIQLDGTFFTDEGYLIDHPIVTSTGIFEYKNADGSIRRELRLPEDVFNADSLKSYKGKPIIVTHKAGYVSKDNVEDEHIGTILSDGYRDGDDVRAEIIIHDTDTMKKSGLRELSLGYNLVLDETAGDWNGQHYDAIQKDIRINHLALVRSARAGDQARLNIDSRENEERGNGMEDEKVKKEEVAEEEEVKKDEDEVKEEEKEAKEETVEDKVKFVTDRRARRDAAGDPEDMDEAMLQIAQQDEDIDTLLSAVEEAQKKKEENKDAEDEEVEEKAEEEEEKKEEVNEDEDEKEEPEEDVTEEIVEAEEEKMNADSIDELVMEKVRVLRFADRMNIDGLDEAKPTSELKVAILNKLNPNLRLDSKDANYISVAFDFAVAEADKPKDTEYQKKQMMRKDSKSEEKYVSASEARERMIKRHKREDK